MQHFVANLLTLIYKFELVKNSALRVIACGWIPSYQGSHIDPHGPVPPLGPDLEGPPRLAQGDHPIIEKGQASD